MMTLALALLAAAVTLAWTWAVRDEHLIVMRWHGRRRILLAHVGAGRYRLISPPGIPLALLRYALRRAEQGLAVLRARALPERWAGRSAAPASAEA